MDSALCGVDAILLGTGDPPVARQELSGALGPNNEGPVFPPQDSTVTGSSGDRRSIAGCRGNADRSDLATLWLCLTSPSTAAPPRWPCARAGGRSQRFAASFVPRTRLGLVARNLVTRAMSIPLVSHWALGRLLVDRLELPDY